MDFKTLPYYQICGQSDAESRLYNLYIGKSGKRWLVANQPNAADNIYVEGGDGFGGSTLKFKLIDGSTIQLTGPWHSNSTALFEDTGIDIRCQHMTYGAIGRGKKSTENWMVDILTDVIYYDKKPVVGSFNRIEELAYWYSEQLGVDLYYYSASKSGSTSGCTKWPKPRR